MHSQECWFGGCGPEGGGEVPFFQEARGIWCYLESCAYLVEQLVGLKDIIC